MTVPHETRPLSIEDMGHGGWALGPGPDTWPLTVKWGEATETGSQPEGAHLVCAGCGQSVTRLGNWMHTWESLKPQVALHVMQVHQDSLTR